MNSIYNWIVDRARLGEPVPIETNRLDFPRIVGFLTSTNGNGLIIQDDSKYGLIWVIQQEN